MVHYATRYGVTLRQTRITCQQARLPKGWSPGPLTLDLLCNVIGKRLHGILQRPPTILLSGLYVYRQTEWQDQLLLPVTHFVYLQAKGNFSLRLSESIVQGCSLKQQQINKQASILQNSYACIDFLCSSCKTRRDQDLLVSFDSKSTIFKKDLTTYLSQKNAVYYCMLRATC